MIEFPERKSLLEQLAEAFGGERPPLARHDLAGRVAEQMIGSWRWLSSFGDPHGVYARLPFDLELN